MNYFKTIINSFFNEGSRNYIPIKNYNLISKTIFCQDKNNEINI